MTVERTCLNRTLKICPCKKDYRNIYPNNTDCPRYIESSIVIYQVSQHHPKDPQIGHDEIQSKQDN